MQPLYSELYLEKQQIHQSHRLQVRVPLKSWGQGLALTMHQAAARVQVPADVSETGPAFVVAAVGAPSYLRKGESPATVPVLASVTAA